MPRADAAALRVQLCVLRRHTLQQLAETDVIDSRLLGVMPAPRRQQATPRPKNGQVWLDFYDKRKLFSL